MPNHKDFARRLDDGRKKIENPAWGPAEVHTEPIGCEIVARLPTYSSRMRAKEETGNIASNGEMEIQHDAGSPRL